MENKKTLLALVLSIFLIMLGNGMVLSVLAKRFIEITGSGENIGYIASYYAISYIIVQLLIGKFSDKAVLRYILYFGCFSCLLSGISYYAATGSTVFFIGRIFGGIGEAPLFAIAPALLSIKYPCKKGRAIGLYNGSMHLGLMIGPGIGLIVQNIWNVKAIFFWYICTCFVSFLILLFGLEKDGVNEEYQPKETTDIKYYYTLIGNKKVSVVLFGVSLYGAGYGALVTIIPDYLMSCRNFTSNYTGIFFTLIYVAIGVAQFITGPLTDKFGPKKFMKVGLISASIGIFSFPYLAFEWNIIISLTLASFGLGVFHLSSLCFMNDIVSHSKKGAISGLYYLFWGIGIFWGPVIIEKLGMFIGIKIAFVVFALAFLIGALVMIVFDKIKDQGILESAVT